MEKWKNGIFFDTNGNVIYVPCDEIIAINSDDEDWLCDYAISELQKPYVEWQRKKWQNEHVSYLRIYVPDCTDEYSSIELQKKSFVNTKFFDVCEYCKHPDLLYLMAEVGKERIKKDASVPNRVIQDYGRVDGWSKVTNSCTKRRICCVSGK